MSLESLKQKINIKYFMVGYLGLLLIFSALMLRQPLFILKGFLMMLCYMLLDVLWTYLTLKSWIWPVSSWISALVLGLVAWLDLPWIFILLLPLLAVFSKHLLHFRKSRHIFNPAAFALAIGSFFVPTIAWWGSAWGTVPLIIVSIAGIFILWRQSRWHEAIAFVLSYLFFLMTLSISSGIINPVQWIEVLRTRILQGTVLFFTAIMLIEPITSQFPTKKQRVIYGSMIGLFAVMIVFLGRQWPLFHADPLVFGLLLGNLTTSLIFLPNAKNE